LLASRRRKTAETLSTFTHREGPEDEQDGQDDGDPPDDQEPARVDEDEPDGEAPEVPASTGASSSGPSPIEPICPPPPIDLPLLYAAPKT
jgi:hypothetical protein